MSDGMSIIRGLHERRTATEPTRIACDSGESVVLVLTWGQRVGYACVVCNDLDGPVIPVGAAAGGGQVFAHGWHQEVRDWIPRALWNEMHDIDPQEDR
jgi:hypothetical protein